MAAKEIAATSKKLDPRVAKINYDFGDDFEGAVAKFGKESILSNFIANAVVTIQAGIRGLAEKGKTDSEIQAVYDAWKPGIARPRVADTTSLLDRFAKLDESKQEDLLAKLKELRAKKAKEAKAMGKA